MSKKLTTITLIISILALCLAGVALVCAGGAAKDSKKALDKKESAAQKESSTEKESAAEEQGDIQYVLYLGTNDKDTTEPVFTPDVAKEKAEEILLKHFGGYTIQEANGGWTSDDKIYREYTLVIYLSDTTIDKVHAAADEMIKTFNQSSVLIQSNKTMTDFYSGN